VENWELVTSDAEHSSQGFLPFRVVKPSPDSDERERRPCVIMLHPTGADRDYHVEWEASLVARGYMTCALDLRHHGGRVDGDMTYQQAIARSYTDHETFKERPFLLDNVWDLQHLLDVLSERPDVDERRIGITGLSLGGMVSWFLAVIDERVFAPVPLCGVQSFSYALLNNKWHGRVMSIPDVFRAAAPGGKLSELSSETVARVWERILPGLLSTYDATYSLGCIAPRPLCVVTGGRDAKNPVEGVREAIAAAQEVYAAQGVGDRIELFAPGDADHELTPAMREVIDEWLDRWLLVP